MTTRSTTTSPSGPVSASRPLSVPDPWAGPVTGRTGGGALPVLAVLGAFVLGSSAVLARLWFLGDNARRGAQVLAVAAVLWEVLLCLGPDRRRWVPAALAVVAVVAEVVSAPWAGRAPAVLLFVSLTISHAALVRWRPTRRWPGRQDPVATLAVPLLVVAQLGWWRSGRPVPMIVLLVGAAAVVEAYHRAPRLVGPIDRGLRHVVVRVADAAGSAVLFVVALPFLYLPGGVARGLGLGRFGRRRRRREPSWTPRGAADTAADAAYPFISPAPAVRRRRHAAAVGVVLVALGVSTIAVLHAREVPEAVVVAAPRPGAAGPDGAVPGYQGELRQFDLLDAVPYRRRPAMRDAPWADALQRDTAEVTLVASPGVGYVTADTSTPLVNVTGGVRRSVPASCAGCPRVDVWLVGASAVFGIGQRDEGTIASALQAIGARDGLDLRVRNLGVVGWTTHQSVEDALRRLRAGEAPPDLVVSVDGFNDAMVALTREFGGRGDDPSPLVFDEALAEELLRSDRPLGAARVEAAAQRAAVAADQELDRLRGALTPRGVPVVSFVQPDALASELQLESVRSLYDVVPGLLERAELGRVLARTAELRSGRATDLRDLYDRVDRPLFIDMVHTNEEGAQRVADAVYAVVRPDLAPPGSTRPCVQPGRC